MSPSGRAGAVRFLAAWWPAVVYPLAFLVASLAVATRSMAQQQTILLWASTNLDNLADHPLRSLAISAFLTDGDVVAWTVLAAVGVAGVVAAAGPWRAVLVAVVAHLVGTAVSEGLLGVRIARGLAPSYQRAILDVGPSFVVVGALLATMVAGTRWWRLVALVAFALVAPSLFGGILEGDVAAIGHSTAIVVGLVAGGLLLGRRRVRAARGAFDGRGAARLANDGSRVPAPSPGSLAGNPPSRRGAPGVDPAERRPAIRKRASTRRRPGAMPVAQDQDSKFDRYAHPERLVTTAWLAEHLGEPGLVVLESDEDVLLYDTGHIPGALKVDWFTELNDHVTRDYVDGARFAEVVGSKGIGRDTTVVLYGDKNNWWAAYALWVFRLFGHEDVRLVDGGRAKWIAEGREITTDVPTPAPVAYPVVERDDVAIRAFKDDVLAHLGDADRPLIDVRSPQEYTGERTHMPDYPQEGTLRGGHIPGARSVPWARAAADDATFKDRDELEAIYIGEQGLKPGDDVIAYCRIGERSSHTWFVLTYLLGFENVRNYDGSWTEWGNTVRVPIVRGEEPGSV